MNVYDYLLGQSGFLYKPFLIGNKEELSYQELYTHSMRLARYLVETYGQGNNVLLISPNTTYFIIAYMAILKSGNVCVPISASVKPSSLSYVLEDCKAKIALISPELECNRWRLIKEVIYDYHGLEGENIGDQQDPLDGTRFDEGRLAEIIPTIGSSGEPKKVMITHGDIISNTESIIEFIKLDGHDAIEIGLPFYSHYGLSLFHSHLKVGGSIVLTKISKFDGSFINDLKNYACTGLICPPSHFQKYLRKTKSNIEIKNPSFQYIILAGGNLKDEIICKVSKSYPNVKFFKINGQKGGSIQRLI